MVMVFYFMLKAHLHLINTFYRKNAYGLLTEKVLAKHFLKKSVIKNTLFLKNILKCFLKSVFLLLF